jgi:hypothetical protein
MILYTCAGKKHGASTPLIPHACGRAAKALDDAGHHYELEVVGGFKHVPFSRRGKRERIAELTGQEDVPVLVTDSGTAVAGSDAIVGWAAENPAA